MAFEFQISTDEIREKMFDFIKPAYKNTVNFDIDYINWIYGAYDSESGFFITYVSSKKDISQYVLLNENEDAFYVSTNRYRDTISEVPDELAQYGDVIQEGIKLYNNNELHRGFRNSFSDEQKKCFDEISEIMKERCRPVIDINSYEDAEKLFRQHDFNYYHICKTYAKITVAKFDGYMTEEKMRAIRGEEYRGRISQIVAYGKALGEEEYVQISKDFREIGDLFVKGIDDICGDMTLEAIKKGYRCGVISIGYIGFIEDYLRTCIKMFPHKIQRLGRIYDFIKKNMRNENYKRLELYRKELEKLIYNKVEGFQIVLITGELREKMFDFLKSQGRINYGWGSTHINWAVGSYDMKSGIFLTQIDRATDGIARGGENVYGYIVITDDGDVFKVNKYEYENRTYKLMVPNLYEVMAKKIKEGIDYYDYEYEYTKILSEDTRRELKQINKTMDQRLFPKA